MQNATLGNKQVDLNGLVGRDGSAGFHRQMPGHVERLAKSRMQDDQKSQKIRPSFVSRILRLCLLLLGLSVLVFLLAHSFGDRLSRAGHTASTTKLEIVINNDYLYIPENKIRFASQRKNGAHEKIDLYMHWPSLSGYADSLSQEFNSTQETANLIFMTIEPQSMAYDMSGRVAPIYQQFFEGAAKQMTFGLVRQGLSARGGYIDEDLYYAPANPYPFATRCSREITTAMPVCIRDIFVGNKMMVTYRFHKKYLQNWIELEEAIRGTVKSMIIKPQAKL